MSRGRRRSRSRRSRRSRGGGRGPRPCAHRKHPLGDQSLDRVEMIEEDVDEEEEEEEEEKARERNNEVVSGGGLSMPDGHWVVHAHTKNAAYNQRFIVSGAKSGNGTYVNKGAKAQVKSDAPWMLNIQNDKGSKKRKWHNSVLKLSKKSEKEFQLNSEDWTDNDFEDFVLSIKNLSGSGILLPPGKWNTCPYKKAAYNQRFVVSEAKKAMGSCQ